MKRIKIFLASSEELADERTKLGDLVSHLNLILHRQDIDIELVKWEYLSQSMEAIHKQDEYNSYLKECDLCIVLYWTRFGIYTKSELDTAYQEHIRGHNPKKLYVYFKKEEADLISEELRAFRDSFPDDYGHFSSEFSNIDSLKSSFLLQLMDYQNTINNPSQLVEIRDSKVYVSDTPVVDLRNVAFTGNNEEYNRLRKDIGKTRRLLSIMDADDPEYAIYAADLIELEKALHEKEESLWNTALTITHLSDRARSERQQRAIDLFNTGDNKGADAILKEEEICRDADQNLRLIRMGEAGKKGLKTNIDELKLKINTLRSERSDGWPDTVYRLHENKIKYTEGLYGEKSHETAEALAEAATDFNFLARYVPALDCNVRALSIMENVYGPGHPTTAMLLLNIGLSYHHLSNYKDALDNYKSALEIWESIEGDNHAAVGVCHNNIGNILSSQGEFGKAMVHFKKALEIRKDLYGTEHPEVASTYNSIGLVLDCLGDHAGALENFNKALEIRQTFFGEEHPEVANSLNNIGTLLYKNGYYPQSLEVHQKALRIKTRIYGANHPAVATSYNNLGFVYDRQGMSEQALQNYEKALKIQLTVFRDGKHSDIARSYNNIAGVYYTMGDSKSSLDYYRKALDIMLELFGENNPSVATLYNNIGLIHHGLGHPAQALENLEKAQRIQLPIFGENHPRVQDIKEVIEELRSRPRD